MDDTPFQSVDVKNENLEPRSQNLLASTPGQLATYDIAERASYQCRERGQGR